MKTATIEIKGKIEMSEITVTKKKNELAIAVDLSELIADSQAGKENIGREEITIPTLMILQDKCKQVSEKNSSYVQGAKPGMVLNSVTGELLDLTSKPVRVIPVGFRKAYVEWGLRETGGGWKGEHPFTQETLAGTIADNKGRIIKGTNQLVETAFHYVFIVNDDGSTGFAVLPMKATSIKVSRKWCTMIQLATVNVKGEEVAVPSYAYSYLLSIGIESNANGEWFNFKILKDKTILDNLDLYNKCKKFAEMVSQNKVKAAEETEVEAASSDDFDGTIQ